MAWLKIRMELQDWKNLSVGHFLLGAALIGVATGAHVVTKTEDIWEDTRVPFYFAAFVIGGLHIVLCGLAGSYYKGGSNNQDIQAAESTIKFYHLVNIVFWAFTVVSIVLAAVEGICTDNEECHYYEKYETNKRLAIAIIVLSSVSFLMALIMMEKTTLERQALNPASVGQSAASTAIATVAYPLTPATTSSGASTGGAGGKGTILHLQHGQQATNSHPTAPPLPGFGHTSGIYQTPASAFRPPPPSYAEVMMPGGAQ